MKKWMMLIILFGMMTLSGCIRSDFSKSKKYFVHLIYLDDVLSRPVAVYEDETLEEALSIPDKPWHRFLYWETPTGEKYYPEDTIHQSLVLIEVFEEIRHLVTFESNGGTPYEPEWVREGTFFITPVPFKEGYVFHGWFTDVELNASYSQYNPIKASMLLYAKWVPMTYTVTYHFSSTMYYSYPTYLYDLFPMIDTNNHYNFDYWYETDPNVPFVFPDFIPNRNIDLYATYK